MKTLVERLTAELEKAKKDAARYRFIRAEWFREDDSWLMSYECACLDTPDEMDAEIDKEMEAKQ